MSQQNFHLLLNCVEFIIILLCVSVLFFFFFFCSQSQSQFPVKRTDPLTPILYITADKEHMDDIKHVVHVREVVIGECTAVIGFGPLASVSDQRLICILP